jgi:replicative DNA helicase
MIKTGYRKIDDFAGGLTRGEISIVGGRPGHGKTTFLVNLLTSLIKGGYKVAMFNRELPNTEVIKKMLCIEMPKLEYRDVRRGDLNEHTIKLLKEARDIITKKYSEDRFVMFDNIRDFPKTASEVKKFNPDVIIDDYIQLVTPTGKEDTRRLQLERICNDYKWLAKENDCAVVIASQLNRMIESRGGDAKRPQLSDLAESGAIEQVAENVFFVYYPYKVEPSTHCKNEIYLVASKVRYGETGEVILGYHGDICTIYDDLPRINQGGSNDNRQIPFD